MPDKYLYNNAGTITERSSIDTSAGAGDAGKIVALDSSGRLPNNMMPTGIGADTASIQASETISAGAFVNVHSVTGSFRVRNADASTTGKQADGFVLAGAASGANATVYFEGTNTQVSSATPGQVWLSDSVPGGFQSSAPTGNGKISQKVGIAVGSSSINFDKGEPIALIA